MEECPDCKSTRAIGNGVHRLKCLDCGRNFREKDWQDLVAKRKEERKGIRKTESLANAQAFAKQKNGKCLSIDYENEKSILDWECHLGHQWKSSYTNVVSGHSWCTVCSKMYYVREELCRSVLEHITGKSFSKIRPDWLVSPKGNSLELDGFNDELKLAFEHNGEQHYKPTWLGENPNYDELKQKQCDNHNVKLLVIPYNIKINDLPKFINNLLPDSFRINNVEEFASATFKDKMIEIKELARRYGGECLSSVYLGHHGKYTFQCGQGHKWNGTYANLKKGRWCFDCGMQVASRTTSNRDKLELHINSCGGKLISGTWKDGQSEFLTECKNGHQFTVLGRVIWNHRRWYCKACEPKSENKICKACKVTITVKRRSVYCSKECETDYKIAMFPSFARKAVYKRDRGVCKSCGLNCSKFFKLVKAATRGTQGKQKELIAQKVFEEQGIPLCKWQHRRTFWDCDHGFSQALGGSLLIKGMLDNLRTLCLPCHLRETARLKVELSASL